MTPPILATSLRARRTRAIAVGTEYAAITRPRLEQRLAALTFEKVHTAIGRHDFHVLRRALRAGERHLKDFHTRNALYPGRPLKATVGANPAPEGARRIEPSASLARSATPPSVHPRTRPPRRDPDGSNECVAGTVHEAEEALEIRLAIRTSSCRRIKRLCTFAVRVSR